MAYNVPAKIGMFVGMRQIKWISHLTCWKILALPSLGKRSTTSSHQGIVSTIEKAVQNCKESNIQKGKLGCISRYFLSCLFQEWSAKGDSSLNTGYSGCNSSGNTSGTYRQWCPKNNGLEIVIVWPQLSVRGWLVCGYVACKSGCLKEKSSKNIACRWFTIKWERLHDANADGWR